MMNFLFRWKKRGVNKGIRKPDEYWGVLFLVSMYDVYRLSRVLLAVFSFARIPVAFFLGRGGAGELDGRREPLFICCIAREFFLSVDWEHHTRSKRNMYETFSQMRMNGFFLIRDFRYL